MTTIDLYPDLAMFTVLIHVDLSPVNVPIGELHFGLELPVKPGSPPTIRRVGEARVTRKRYYPIHSTSEHLETYKYG